MNNNEKMSLTSDRMKSFLTCCIPRRMIETNTITSSKLTRDVQHAMVIYNFQRRQVKGHRKMISLDRKKFSLLL